MQAADRRLSAANIANDHLDRLGELLEPFRQFKKLLFDAGVGCSIGVAAQPFPRSWYCLAELTEAAGIVGIVSRSLTVGEKQKVLTVSSSRNLPIPAS